jgi:dihydroorotase-like cyclic amidohydrolase
MAIVHAENQQLVDYFTEHYRDTLGRHDAGAWTEARNLSVVLTGVLDAIVLAKQFGVKLYLLHQSTPEEFAAIEFGRSLGVDVYGEVTTVHLAFNSEDYAQHGHRINIAPAIRTRAVQDRLWELLRSGKIDTVVTDHAPHTLAEKDKDSVWDVASGLPGLQESVASLVTGWIARFGRDTLEHGLIRIGQVTSANIARIFGYPQKGGIVVGKDADMVAIDIENPWIVKREDLFTKNRWSAFEGMSLLGQPTTTILRGQIVYQNHQIIGEPYGQHIIR